LKEVAMATMEKLGEAEKAFTVRMLKYGTCEVVTKPDAETPARHISDFRSEAEAQAWIRESGPDWMRRQARKS
jgi:hypothetical protein